MSNKRNVYTFEDYKRARGERHIEPLRWTLKSAFDRNAVVNFDIQELVFDYIFTHLGIDGQLVNQTAEADEGPEMEADVHEESDEPSRAPSASQPMFNVAEYHQLFVGTERLRVPEILFQPSLIGDEQMGLMETLQFVLEQYCLE